jgi:hypothetical protein
MADTFERDVLFAPVQRKAVSACSTPDEDEDGDVYFANPCLDSEVAAQRKQAAAEKAEKAGLEARATKYQSAKSLKELLALRPEGLADIDIDVLNASVAAMSKQPMSKQRSQDAHHLVLRISSFDDEGESFDKEHGSPRAGSPRTGSPRAASPRAPSPPAHGTVLADTPEELLALREKDVAELAEIDGQVAELGRQLAAAQGKRDAVADRMAQIDSAIVRAGREISIEHTIFENCRLYESTTPVNISRGWSEGSEQEHCGAVLKGQVVRVKERRRLGDQSCWLRCSCDGAEGWVQEEVDGKVMLMGEGQSYYAVTVKTHARKSWEINSAKTTLLEIGDIIFVQETHLFDNSGEVRARFSQGWVSINDMKKGGRQILRPIVAKCKEQQSSPRYKKAGSVSELLAMRSEHIKSVDMSAQ